MLLYGDGVWLVDKDKVAREVLDALGGRNNVVSNTVCMTRLRVSLNDPQAVDYEALSDIKGVLGTAARGQNGLEVVFGPRVIDGIYHAFILLTGISGGIEDLFPMSRLDTNMRVQIRTSKTRPANVTTDDEQKLINDDEMSVLEGIFGKREDEPKEPKLQLGRLAVINGPNLNMLGIMSSGDKEADDFPNLLELCKHTAQAAGFSRCDCYQSNHEGDLVDMVQDCLGTYEAIVINPGAYGSSGALRDAIRAIPVPAMEVHRHDLDTTDEVGTACVGTTYGLGSDGYRVAIQSIARHIS